MHRQKSLGVLALMGVGLGALLALVCKRGNVSATYTGYALPPSIPGNTAIPTQLDTTQPVVTVTGSVSPVTVPDGKINIADVKTIPIPYGQYSELNLM